MSNRVPYGASGRVWSLSGMLRDLVTAWRLVRDPSVPSLLKLAFPFLALLYLISPFDLLPGPIDDLAVLVVAARLFLSLAPSAARMRHGYEGEGGSAGNGPSRRNTGRDDDDAIDTTWRVIED